MSNWYYTVGGIFLTNDSRDEYFDVQNYLQEEIKDGDDENKELDNDIIEDIFNKGSILRTKLTKELGSRTSFHSIR